MNTRTIIDASSLPKHEVERLVMAVTETSRNDVLAGFEIGDDEVAHVDSLIDRRAAGEPLQYLEGTAAFGPIEVTVDRRVLVPRPETEQLWERFMEELGDRTGTVVDMCTGSGCIALATKHVRHDLTVVGTDLSGEALDVARSNGHRLGLDVAFRQGDLFDALDPSLRGSIAAIVSNPPYVSIDEWADLPTDVRDHEPRAALVAEEDGLAFYRRFAQEAGDWLAGDGFLMAEIGEEQGEQLVLLFASHGWTVDIEFDLARRDRFVMVRR